HLLALINDILDLSKIEAGKMELYLEEFPVAAIVEDVTATVRPLVEKNANRLAVEVEADCGIMTADVTKIRQVLFNLLSNASKFTKEGEISLRVARREQEGQDWIVFTIADTGIGLTREQMEHLFQPFSQGDASTTREYGGTGLGLAISQRFCMAMGGEIGVDSPGGKGSTFVVRLPALVASPGNGGRAAGTAFDATSVPDGGATVLVIDDDPAVRELMKRFLSREGYRVITARDGDEGLTMARQFRPMAITLDVLMPKSDGWAVLRTLKSDAELQGIPVIMLTIVDDKNLGFALGASDYLSKPIDRGRLAAALEGYRCDEPPCVALVVEDDRDTRELLCRALEAEGWAVSQAGNGREGLERLREKVPRIILLDLMMPEVDGFEFIDFLRREEAWREIPVIVITAADIGPKERKKLNDRATRIIEKGNFGREDLLGQVRQLVATLAGSAGGGREISDG
ncbi:MAG: response regulator, partial [bacterium]